MGPAGKSATQDCWVFLLQFDGPERAQRIILEMVEVRGAGTVAGAEIGNFIDGQSINCSAQFTLYPLLSRPNNCCQYRGTGSKIVDVPVVTFAGSSVMSFQPGAETVERASHIYVITRIKLDPSKCAHMAHEAMSGNLKQQGICPAVGRNVIHRFVSHSARGPCFSDALLVRIG